MATSDVEKALVTAAQGALSGLSFALENSPPAQPSGKWGAIFYNPAQPAVDSLGPNGDDLFEGFLQVDVNYPRGSGVSAAQTDLDTLRASFKAGASFTSGGQAVRIKNCGRPVGRLVDNWYRVSFTIYWWAFVPR